MSACRDHNDFSILGQRAHWSSWRFYSLSFSRSVISSAIGVGNCCDDKAIAGHDIATPGAERKVFWLKRLPVVGSLRTAIPGLHHPAKQIEDSVMKFTKPEGAGIGNCVYRQLKRGRSGDEVRPGWRVN
jgi:hypothetical protein